MNTKDHAQSEGTLRWPRRRLPFGVAVFALCLYAGYALTDSGSYPLVPMAFALVASAIFWKAEGDYYSARQTGISWVSRTVVSGLLAFPIYLLLAIIISFPFDYFHVNTGNLFVVFCLYYLWSWKFRPSFTECTL